MKYLITYLFLLITTLSFSQDWINGRYYSGAGGQSLWIKLTNVEFYSPSSGLSELNSQSEDFVVLDHDVELIWNGKKPIL